MTILTIMKCKAISCVVLDARKAIEVRDTLNDEISTKCPTTILRKHPHVKLFLDLKSASKITE